MKALSPSSTESVLSLFRQEPCLDLRRLAFRLGLSTADAVLMATLRHLQRSGKISRIGGRGRHTQFALATFES